MRLGEGCKGTGVDVASTFFISTLAGCEHGKNERASLDLEEPDDRLNDDFN